MSGRKPTEVETERDAMELLEAALELPSTERLTFITSTDSKPEPVRKRAEELLSLSQGDDTEFVTGKAQMDFGQDDPLPDLIGGYKVLKLLGRGGMGNVYLAQRASDDFDHLAAIKVIKRNLLTDEIAERFRRERQILAELNHPHIAQLYDGGELDDGSPYIIMEYIDGEPLQHWLESSTPDRASALTVFDQICEAVSFAHQNLIVHRDLTPSNVLIASDGRAKLIDFGIARPPSMEDAGISSTTGYTPGFAAPERQSDSAVNVLSDVYSLGQLLALMTESARDREIDAIIAKASAQDPKNRYTSVAGLRADIAAYREGRPVSAYRGSAFYSVRKFASRQKVLVGAMTSSFALLVVGIIAISSAYRSAEAAREQAEEAFAETRAIANTMMFDVYDEVQKVPGGTKAQVLLARTAQDYLNSLTSRETLGDDVRLDAGLGYLRLARVVGSTRGNTLGDLESGMALYERSRDVLEPLYRANPNDPTARAAYGQALVAIAGEKLFTEADIEAAKSTAIEAQQVLSGLSETEATAEALTALGRSYYFLGEATAWNGDYEAAIKVCEEGIRKLDATPQSLAGDLEVRRAKATLVGSMSGHQANAGQLEKSIKALERSIQLRTALAQASDNAPPDVRTLTISHYTLSDVLRELGRREAARIQSNRALDLSRTAMARDPSDAGPKELFAASAIQSARLAALGRDAATARRLLTEALTTSRQLRDLSADTAAGPITYATRLQETSDVFGLLADKGKSCSAAREAAKILTSLKATDKLPPAVFENNLKPMQEYLKSC